MAGHGRQPYCVDRESLSEHGCGVESFSALSLLADVPDGFGPRVVSWFGAV